METGSAVQEVFHESENLIGRFSNAVMLAWTQFLPRDVVCESVSVRRRECEGAKVRRYECEGVSVRR